MTRTTIIGGHGKVALRLTRLLTATGHDVTSWVRNPDHVADVEAAGATALVADAERLDVEEMAARLAAHDAVVWSAGAGGGDPARTYAVDRDAAIRSMAAAEAAEVPRFVMVSYFYDRPEHGVPPDSTFFPYAEAKAAADDHLRATSLAWTILGPSRLTDEPGIGRIETGPGVRPRSVSRDDVAEVVSQVLETPSTVHRTIDFNSGSTPIVDAL
ncbi:uncharacterized protein YbjT (DUF2867 family) [Marmoricola sp. URHA0025 HA25]